MTKDMSAVLVYKTKESNYKSIVHVHEWIHGNHHLKICKDDLSEILLHSKCI